MNHAYKVGETILTWEGELGKIESTGTSMIDNKDIPSYWIVFSKKFHPDGYARNTWESSIRCSTTEKNCKNCKDDNCCFFALICIPFGHKYFK